MKKRLLLNLIILALALTILPHCGGGGGGGNNPGPSGPTTAVLTLSTALTGSLPANETVNGYSVTVTLPAGVTIKTDTSGAIDSSVLTASGVATGSLIGGDYAPAIVGTPGKITIVITNTDRINPGEFCKVTCTIASGSPSASDFQQYTFVAKGYVHTDIANPANDTVTDVDLTNLLSLTVGAVIH